VDPFVFPDPPNAKALEWPGPPIGAGNVITRVKALLPTRDVAIDRVEGRRDELVTSAVEHVVRHAGAEPLAVCDAVIHGVRVRVITNSTHLEQFWTAHWYRPDEWRRATGLTPPARPQVTIYAIGGVADQQQGAYYSHRTGTVVLFNTTYYGELWSAALAAAGRLLAEERGIHSLHAGCVGGRDGGVVCLGPAGTGKAAAAFGLASRDPGARFLSQNTVHVRYTLAMRDGRRVAPFEIIPVHGRPVRGYRVFRWLDTHRGAAGEFRGTGLDHADVRAPLSALDLTGPVEAYAYASTKATYVRTDLLGLVPGLAAALLAAPLENVPDVTPEGLAARAAMLDVLANAVLGTPDGDAESRGARDDVRMHLTALLACPAGRAMLDPARGLAGGGVVAAPMDGVRLSTVVLLRRDPRDRTVLDTLPLARFITRVLTGEAPDGTRQVAYNPHRAASPDVERAAVDALASEAAARAGGAEAFYHAFERSPAVPPTLAFEGELFRMLHRATRCYDLNAIVGSDPDNRDSADAQARTNALIAYAAAPRAGAQHLDLDGAREALAAAAPLAAGEPTR